MPVSTSHNLSNYTVGGPSFTGTFSLEGMPQGAPLCDKMGALLNDGIFTEWVRREAGIEELNLHEFTLVVQDNLLNLHVNNHTYTFKGDVQPLHETTTTAMLRSELTELFAEPAQMQNNHLIPIIETAQNIFGQRSRSVGYSQAKETGGDTYRYMAEMHHDAQITHREAIASYERIIRDLIDRGLAPEDLPASVREGIASYAPPRDLSDEVARLREELNEAQAARDEALAANAELSSNHDQLDAEKQSLAQELRSAQDRLAITKEDREALTRELSATEERLRKAEGELRSRKGELKNAQAERDAARDDLRHVRAEVEQAKSTLEETEAAHASARRELAEAQERLHEIEEELTTAKSANDTLRSAQDETLGRARELEVKLAKAQRGQQEAKTHCATLQMQLKKLQAEADAQRETVVALQAGQEEAQLQLGQFGGDFEEERAQLQARYEKLASQYKLLEEAYRKTLLQNQGLASQLEEFASAKARILTLEKELKAHATVLAASAQETGRLRGELKERYDLYEKLLADFSSLEERHEYNIKRLNQAHRSEVGRLQNLLTQREGEMSRIEAEYSEQLRHISAELADARREHADKIAQLEEELADYDAELLATDRKGAQERSQLIAEMSAEYEARIQALEEEKERARIEYNSNIERAYKKVEAMLQDSRETIERQSREIEDLKESQRQMIEQAKMVAAQTDAQYRTYESQIEKLQSADEVVQKEAKAAAMRVEELERQAARDKANLQNLEALLEEKTLSLSAVTAALNEQSAYVVELEESLAQARDAADQAQADLSHQISKNTSEMLEKSREIDELKTQVIRYESQLEERDMQIEEIATKARERASEHALEIQGVYEEMEEQKSKLTQEALRARQGADQRIAQITAEHEGALSNLESAVSDRDALIDDLKTRLAIAEKKQGVMQGDFETAQAALEKAEQKIVRETKLHRALQEKYLALESIQREDIEANSRSAQAHDTLTKAHDRLVRENANLKEQLESEMEESLNVIHETYADLEQAKARAIAAEESLAEAIEQQTLLEEQVQLLRDSAQSEADVLLRIEEATRRADKAEGELTTLMNAIRAANTPGNSDVIQSIFEQYQASRTSKLVA